jgi:hypothetical protein
MQKLKILRKLALLGFFLGSTSAFAYPLDGFYCTLSSGGTETVMHFVPANADKDQGSVTTYTKNQTQKVCIGKKRNYKFENYNNFSDDTGMKGWVSYFGLIKISAPANYVGDYTKGSCDVAAETDPC